MSSFNLYYGLHFSDLIYAGLNDTVSEDNDSETLSLTNVLPKKVSVFYDQKLFVFKNL